MKVSGYPKVFALFGLFSLMVAGPGLAKDKVVVSQWASEPLEVDGLNLEWTADALTSKDDMKVSYAFRNDDKDLYLVFVFNDPKYLSTIDATGMTVYFNAEGKKKKDNGVIFKTKRATPQELIANWEKEGQTVSDERKRELMSRPYYIVFWTDVINKKPDKTTAAAAGTTVSDKPPVFRNGFKDKLAVYEFRIPLSRAGQPGGVGAVPGQTIKFGFEWGGMTEQMRKEMIARRAAMGSQAGAPEVDIDNALGEGDESVDLGQGGPSGFSRGPKQYSFWIDLKLAAAPGGF